MSEFVIMPKSDYEAACNSIRAKTGKTDLIKSGAMSAEIDSITTGGGGGSSADVRYVTFMSYDGSVEYGKIPVAIGYDCPNPKFADPTRESTAKYSYTFDGWATTTYGGVASNWNKSITEDKTVYAHFKSSVRSYTITFYDSDGTKLKEETLTYGTMPEYAPAKADHSFEGWEPALTTVTGNANYYAVWKAISGFSELITFLPSEFTSASRFYTSARAAINNAGTMVAFATGSYQTERKSSPAVFDISNGTPVRQLLYGVNYSYPQAAVFNYNDTELLTAGTNTSKSEYAVGRISMSDYSTISQTSGRLNSTDVQCSPVADIWGYCYGPVNGSYVWRQNTGDINGISSATYSPDGIHLYFNKSFYTLDGTKVAENVLPLAGSVYFNENGSLCAARFSSAPWVSIYETKNFTKLYDLSDILSAAVTIAFMGSNILLIGSGASITARTITENGHEPYKYDLPAYEESGDIMSIRTSNNRRKAVIMAANKATVWSLA